MAYGSTKTHLHTHRLIGALTAWNEIILIAKKVAAIKILSLTEEKGKVKDFWVAAPWREGGSPQNGLDWAVKSQKFGENGGLWKIRDKFE